MLSTPYAETTTPPDQRTKTARYVLATVLWFHARFDRWPSTLELGRMRSWREPGREDAVHWLRQESLLVKEHDANGYIVHRVSQEARQLMTPPSMERVISTSLDDIEKYILPDDPDEHYLLSWIDSWYSKNDRWPTPWVYESCGLYQRDVTVFRNTLQSLIDQGRLARIHVRRGRRNVTRLIDTVYCPAYEGKDGYIYFWDVTLGEFPEP